MLIENLSLMPLTNLKCDFITQMSEFVEDNQASTPELIRKTVSTQRWLGRRIQSAILFLQFLVLGRCTLADVNDRTLIYTIREISNSIWQNQCNWWPINCQFLQRRVCHHCREWRVPNLLFLLRMGYLQEKYGCCCGFTVYYAFTSLGAAVV